VTEWPRRLVAYVPSGATEGRPSPEEDRDRNRLQLAARLLAVLRSEGRSVDALVGKLREAERAYRSGEGEVGRRIVDEVLDEVEPASGRPSHRAKRLA